MPAVTPTLNEKKVRKWGTMKFMIADDDATIPDELFGGDYLPISLPPTGFKDLGWVTTEGISSSDSLTSESDFGLQSLEPTRADLTGRERSLQVVFKESNNWVNSLFHHKLVSEFDADRDAAWDFTDSTSSDLPYYRILLAAQDGVGDAAVYRFEVAYRAKVTAKTDRALSRSAETFGFTFGLFRDPVLDKTFRRAEDGPSMHGSSLLPVVANATPSGAAVGDVLKVTGNRFTGVTGITLDGETVTDYQVHDTNTLYIVVPAAVTGAADLIVTTSAGASNTYEYTAAT